MGLHLNYELRLPASTSDEDVDRVLGKLHEFAMRQPFDEVSPLVHWTNDATSEPTGWSGAIRLWGDIIAMPWDGEESPKLYGERSTARAFFINAGDGCETAGFGFMARGPERAAPTEWFWYCTCKTQYASVVSDAHLILCHTGLVSVLDHARSVGVDVTVRDETRYWDTRDESVLVEEVHRMNRIVARFAGRFDDAVGDAYNVEAPIFEHPQFERLEMEE